MVFCHALKQSGEDFSDIYVYMWCYFKYQRLYRTGGMSVNYCVVFPLWSPC